MSRDIEVATQLGRITASIENIESTLRDIKVSQDVSDRKMVSCQTNSNDRFRKVETFQANQKAYFAALLFIGGSIFGAVDWLVRNYDRIKNN